MKKNSILFFLFSLSLMILSGCEFSSNEVVIEKIDANFRMLDTEDFRAELPEYFANQLGEFENARINNFDVAFIGRNTEKNNGEIVNTTFYYKVSGTGKSGELEKFFLQVPSCAGSPDSWEPKQSSKLDMKGITWTIPIGQDGSRDFSITFPGDVPLGVIEASVTRAGKREKCTLMGPCAGVTDICGSIFIDANADGIKQNSESGIPDIDIVLRDKKTGGIVGVVPTTEDGTFEFQVLKGEYSVEAVNDLLNFNYNPSTPTSAHFCTDDNDGTCINFGYTMDEEKMVSELEDGTIEGTAECTDYWVDQLKYCGSDKGDYTEIQMLDFLKQIENLLLYEPFQFGNKKIKKALEILKPVGNTEIELFLKELLTAELNVVSQRGAITIIEGETVLYDNFNKALLIYCEAIGCEELGTCSVGVSGRLISNQSGNSRILTSHLVRATRTLSAFNGTGGIRN